MAAISRQDVLGALSALSQETRLEIHRLLVQAGPGGRSAGAIAEALGVAPATLSFHLSQLSHAGLIAQRREGRSLIYSANFARMNAVIAFLTENCCGSGTQAPVCAPETAETGGTQHRTRPMAAHPDRD